MKRTNLRKSNGITLIALVITIIVLLILAGVAIAMLSGENGILKKSTEAKQRTAEAKRDETLKLEQYEGILNRYSEKKWSLATDENGKVTEVINGTTKIPLGSQINYDPYTGVDKDYLKITTSKTKNGAEDQTFEIKDNDKQKLTWRVLGVDDNGQILIMPTTNVKNSQGAIQRLTLGDINKKLKESGKTAALYGAEEINNVCSIYGFGKGAAGARSVQVEDINRLTKYDETKSNLNTIKEYGQDVTYSLENGKVNTQWGTTAKTQSSITSFTYLDGNQWKSLEETSNPSKTLKCTYYEYKMSDYKTNLCNDNIYNLIADGTDTIKEQYYWIGSSSVTTVDGYAGFGIRTVYSGNVSRTGMFNTKGDPGGATSGLRPVVCLKSDITLKETSENSGIYNIQ